MREPRRVFLQSRYKADWVLRVSRYKVVQVFEICLSIVILLTALAGGAPMSQRSGDWGRGALITNKLLSGTTEQNAKTVTSFCTLLSVLEVSCAILSPGIGTKKQAWEAVRIACRLCSSSGFVNFIKTKPLNCNMQAACRASRRIKTELLLPDFTNKRLGLMNFTCTKMLNMWQVKISAQLPITPLKKYRN